MPNVTYIVQTWQIDKKKRTYINAYYFINFFNFFESSFKFPFYAVKAVIPPIRNLPHSRNPIEQSETKLPLNLPLSLSFRRSRNLLHSRHTFHKVKPTFSLLPSPFSLFTFYFLLSLSTYPNNTKESPTTPPYTPQPPYR